ncbi:MAG: PulJ/GspJ family protein [Pseudobdellovibrionaceae bacterium]
MRKWYSLLKTKNVSIKNYGFSLIEILITIGIAGIISLAIATITTTLIKQNKALQQKLESIELEQNTVRLLADNNSCNCIFQGLPFTGAETLMSDGIKNGCSGYLIKPNSLISANGSGLKISTIKLDTLNIAEKSADLLINFAPGSIVGSLKPIRIKSLRFVISGTNIDQCFGVAGSKEVCISMGGTWQNNTCSFAAPASQTCASLGGSWTGSSCTLPTPSVSGSTLCSSLGGTWGGSSCSFAPTTTTTPLPTSAPVPALIAGGNCPSGQFVVGIDTDGTPRCAGSNSSNSVGSPCGNGGIIINTISPTGQPVARCCYLMYFNNGRLLCDMSL